VLPRCDRAFLIRLCVIAALAYAFFGHVCVPARVHGESMDPTYHDGSFNFCWRPRYARRPPAPGDIVMVRFSGRRNMLLKRVVAGAGDQVAFRSGVLHVNGEPLDEPYVTSGCNWELPLRTVDPGHVYVIGDNRGMPMKAHRFGQTPLTRVVGGPVL
jgi:signal peptidase I